MMSLKSKNLHLKNWQDVLPDVLHSIVLSCAQSQIKLLTNASLGSHVNHPLVPLFSHG